ncbi:hypothetical protein [Panacagrimonas sp.]|uniref:hypothetical protein n=1 Tax=Panacagrimonas sp. TaxID=2480088 RepID=UPI003B51DAFE
MGAFRYSAFVSAALGLVTANAQSASLSELMDRVPAPPQTVAAALSWVRDGQIVAPEYTRFRQALDAERAAIVELNGGPLPVQPVAPSLGAPEAPEVQGALQAYTQYLQEYSGKAAPDAALGKRARWLHAAMSGRLGAVLGQMKPCPMPCEDPAALAQNQPLMGNRDQLAKQDIAQWNTLFQDWKSKRRAVVVLGQTRIAGTETGAKALTPAGRSVIAQYRAALLKEIEVTLSITELALKRAFAIETADVDAVSGSTYAPAQAAATAS